MPNIKRLKKPAAAIFAFGLLFMNATLAAAASPELSLDDSIALALKNSPAIKMANADKDKADGGLDAAKTGNLPTLSLGSTYAFQQSQPTLGEDHDFSNSLRLNWQLYSGGRVEGQIDQARKNLDLAGLDVKKTGQQVILDATTAYYNVLQARRMVAVNQETTDSLREHLKDVQVKYEAGVVAKADVLRSEVELANAEQNLTKAQNGYDLAVASLNNIMGVNANSEYALKDELAYAKYDHTFDESMEIAMKNRPDIAQADIGVNVAQDGVKIADSGRLPTIAMTGSTAWNDSVLPDNSNNWAVGLTANFNIFDAGLTKANVKQSQASLDKAREQAQQTRDSVQLEVRKNYLSMQEAEKRIETTNVAVDKAKEDLNIAREKYNAGVGINLDVIDAQVAFTQANTNYLQALYDYNVNKAKLNKAMGVNAGQ
ncbi:MAG TPA: TolC family protein [Methylomusa anaerophila]|uniref:Outer membrane protein TolC n=1 Tax=Methylomusa anaerophila TaxID=1930071 RepID=A0A348AM98_9FIRM|nr:TolC family protein [Methylomusa anaerophila]BBB92196.1 outer membrane protein TolC precursor [Methylomusa anaerophila]HML87790.1 TolC family protein [Methylomusa anaerophila]